MRPLLQIDPSRIRENFLSLCRFLNAPRGVAVVKDDGYGLGMEGVVQALAEIPDAVEAFAVASLEEATELARWLPPEKILVLYAPPTRGEIRDLLESPFQVAVGTSRVLEALRQTPSRPGLHLHVDIGMNRLGLSEEQALAVLEAHPWEGLMLHFPLAPWEDPEGYGLLVRRARRWMNLFRGVRPEGRVHIANTALALSGESWLSGSFPRAGLGLWGLAPSPEIPSSLELAFELRAPVVEVKEVPAGAGISYGWTFRTTRTSRIGVVAVGYADGLPRALSGKGFVVYRNRRFPMVGAVTMDLVMVDFTEGPVPEVGEEVVLLGSPPAMHPWDWARFSGTIVYEVLTGLGKRALRRFVPEQVG